MQERGEKALWCFEDPREFINKRACIVILRPKLSGWQQWDVGLADVDTKNQWVIITSFKDHPVIVADEEWDQDWCWTFAPQGK